MASPPLPHSDRLTVLELVGCLRHATGVATALRKLCTSLRVARGVHLADLSDKCATKEAAYLATAPVVELLMVVELHSGDAQLPHRALMHACERGLHSCVASMLLHPRVNPAVFGPLYNASSRGHTDVVRLLLADPRVDPRMFDSVALRCAVKNGHAAVVKLLLADPRVISSDRFACEAARDAAKGGHTEVLRLLLADPRVFPSADDNAAIWWGAMGGHTELVRLLLADPRVNPAARDNGALRFAVQKGATELVRLLLSDPRVDPAAEDNEAIRFASEQGRTDIVRLLLAHPLVDPSAGSNIAFSPRLRGEAMHRSSASFLPTPASTLPKAATLSCGRFSKATLRLCVSCWVTPVSTRP